MDRATVRRLLHTYMETPAVRMLVAIGLGPNAVTYLGLLLSVASAGFLSTGSLALGGIVLLVAGVFDLLDGAVARLTGRASRFGALLDSTVDRVSEAVVLLGLLVFYLNHSSALGTVLVYVAMVGSMMVSYVRARAEGLGVHWTGGTMTRPERVVALGVSAIIGQWLQHAILVVLAVIAGLTLVTVVQRVRYVQRVLAAEDAPNDSQYG